MRQGSGRRERSSVALVADLAAIYGDTMGYQGSSPGRGLNNRERPPQIGATCSAARVVARRRPAPMGATHSGFLPVVW